MIEMVSYSKKIVSRTIYFSEDAVNTASGGIYLSVIRARVNSGMAV